MRYLIILAVLFFSNGYAQDKNKKSFTLRGRISNAKNSVLYLKETKPLTDAAYSDSTLTDEAGNFSISGVIQEPRMLTLKIKGRKSLAESATFIADNHAVMTMEGLADSLYKSEIKGSEEHSLLTEFSAAYQKEMADFSKEVYKIYQEAKNRNDSVTMKRESGIANLKVTDKACQMLTVFIGANPSRALSLELIDMLMKYSRLKTADSLMQLIEKTPAGEYALSQRLRKRIDILKRLQIGAIAPEFSQPDTAGRQVSLSAFRGKYVLVDFWASWCVPCRAENPHVLKAYEKYKESNFTVLGVSLDHDRKSWINAIHQDKLPWMQLSDLKGFDNEAGKLYAVSSIPANYLLDPQGKIVAVNLRGIALEEFLEKVIK